jgi:hypothetical protein
VTIDLWPKYCSARWKTWDRLSGRSCMSPSIGAPPTIWCGADLVRRADATAAAPR